MEDYIVGIDWQDSIEQFLKDRWNYLKKQWEEFLNKDI